MLVVADAGHRAIGAQPTHQPTVAPRPTRKGRRQPKGQSVRSPPGRQRQSGGEGTEPPIRADTKQARVIDLLCRPEGATVEELAKATGWQHHPIRVIIAGAMKLKKKLGFTVTSQKTESGGRRYQIAE